MSRRLLETLSFIGLAATWLAASAPAADTDAPRPSLILDTYSYWRAFAVFRPVAFGVTVGQTAAPGGSPRTPLPPAD